MKTIATLFLILLAAGAAAAGYLWYSIEKPYGRYPSGGVFVDIPHGASRWKIAGILRSNDVIRNRLAFTLFSAWHFRKRMQAGEYLFDHPLNSREAFWKISHGQIFVHIVTIPEGWTMFDIAAEFERQGICSRQEFLADAHDTSLVWDLSPQARSLEGFLFPSTYEFTRHTTCEQAVRRMVQNFRSVWESLVPADAPPPASLTPAQVVTLASLVERETSHVAERPLVAGVFYNRLRLGDALQCDPTVQYAMAVSGRPIKGVHPQDLRIDSPYNTYQHRGLPPGPIANPGEASLRAALMPTSTDYLYFVANDEGGHFFSRTLEEHNRNVARLRHMLAVDATNDSAAKKAAH